MPHTIYGIYFEFDVFWCSFPFQWNSPAKRMVWLRWRGSRGDEGKRMKSVYCFDKNNLRFSLYLPSVHHHITIESFLCHLLGALYLLTFFPSLSLFFHRLLFELCTALALHSFRLFILQTTKIWERRAASEAKQRANERTKKNQFSFHVHRRRLAHKKHSLFSLPFEKIVHSNFQMSGLCFAWTVTIRSNWNCVRCVSVCAWIYLNIFNNKNRFVFLSFVRFLRPFLSHSFDAPVLSDPFDNPQFEFYRILFHEMGYIECICAECMWVCETSLSSSNKNSSSSSWTYQPTCAIDDKNHLELNYFRY